MDQNIDKTYQGWAVVELYGHAKEVGFITTEYFGTACLFRIDVPELAEREVELKRPEYADNLFVPAGAKVKRGAVAARTRYVGPGAIYSLNPCTEETARAALESMTARPVAIVSMPESKQLLPGESKERAWDDGNTDDSEEHDYAESN